MTLATNRAASRSQHAEPFDIVVNVNGEPLDGMKTTRGVEKVELLKAPFGLKSLTKPGERGWIYLERFIAVVKVAMSSEDEAKLPISKGLRPSRRPPK